MSETELRGREFPGGAWEREDPNERGNAISRSIRVLPKKLMTRENPYGKITFSQ
jgi:hypothetical protein